nr:hypothetical protein [Qipengyuania sphaerica]
MAEALNALDYERLQKIASEDLTIFNARSGSSNGLDAFIEKDRKFREQAGRPQIIIEDLIHHDDEILVSGQLESKHADVGGPTMWRVEFDGPLIRRIEITRTELRAHDA